MLRVLSTIFNYRCRANWQKYTCSEYFSSGKYFLDFDLSNISYLMLDNFFIEDELLL